MRLPIGWRPGTVADICQMQNGHGFGPKDWDTKGLPIIRIQNLNGGKNFDYYSGTPDPEWLVKPGQLLFAWAGSRGVSFGPTIWRGPLGVLNQHIFKLEPKKHIDGAWLYWALRYVTNRIEGQAHGFKATLVHVKRSDISRQSISIPPLREQQKIATTLTVWDEAIRTTELLLANKREQKRALAHTLLKQRVRLHGCNDRWRSVNVDEIFERVIRKNNNGNANVLTISGQDGLISQRDFFTKSVASENLTGYTLLERGEFAYNKSYSHGYPMGAIKPLERYESGVVSSLYICFRMRGGDESSFDFFRHYFEAGLLNREISSIAQEGARNHGLLNVGVSDFFALRLRIPHTVEQKRIAEILNVAETEQRVLGAQLVALKAERAALMQQLLAGASRIQPSEPAKAAAA